jgi:hypothetical protein
LAFENSGQAGELLMQLAALGRLAQAASSTTRLRSTLMLLTSTSSRSPAFMKI